VTSRDLNRWLAWGTTVVILILCLAPLPKLPEGDVEKRIPNLDKLVHFAMFAAFGYFWCASVVSKKSAMKILTAGLALGIGTELLQGIPIFERDPGALDALADGLGVVAGVVVGWPRESTPDPARGFEPLSQDRSARAPRS
jgi:hypothetical protein